MLGYIGLKSVCGFKSYDFFIKFNFIVLKNIRILCLTSQWVILMVITYGYCIIIVHILMDKWQFWYTRKTQDTKWFPFSSICEVFCRKHFLIMCKNIYIVRYEFDPQMIFSFRYNLHALLFSCITVTEKKIFLDYIEIIDWNILCT